MNSRPPNSFTWMNLILRYVTWKRGWPSIHPNGKHFGTHGTLAPRIVWSGRAPGFGRVCLVRSGRSTPMTFPYNRGWETQPNSRGFYTRYKDSVIKGGMTIPNIATLDHGTYNYPQMAFELNFVWSGLDFQGFMNDGSHGKLGGIHNFCPSISSWLALGFQVVTELMLLV